MSASPKPPRARAGSRSKAPEPSVSTWVTRDILLELDARGVAAEPLLARHGLSRVQLMDPDGRLPLRLHAALLHDATAATGDPAFAAAAGRHFRAEATGVVGHAAALAETLREAFEVWARFGGLLVDGFRVTLASQGGRDVVAFAPGREHEVLLAGAAAFPAAMTSFVTRLAPGVPLPLEIRLPGPAPEHREALERAMVAPLRFGAAAAEVHYPAGTFDMRLGYADARVKAMLLESASRSLALRGGPTAEARVRAAVVELGFMRSRALGAVAEALGTSARTLQRRLAEEGLSYTAVRDEALRAAAVQRLVDSDLPVAAVAFELGFASRSAFHRALRRWTGKTPGALRLGR